jgi:hypothetical protein
MQGELLSAFRSFGAKMQRVLGLEIGDCNTQSDDDHGEKKIVNYQVVGTPLSHPNSSN